MLTLDPTAPGLTFQIDGPGRPALLPFFKIRQWRSLTETPIGQPQRQPARKDRDYKAAVKPLSRAHWA